MASNRGPNAIGGATNSVSAPAAPSEYYKAKNAQGGQSLAWAAGGVSVGAPSSTNPPAPGGVGGSWANVPALPPPTSAAPATIPSVGVTPSPAPAGNNSFGTSGLTGDGAYEKNLIAELCPPGGMKAEPPADRLAEFARAIPSLNPDLVCPALLDALEDGTPWIVRAKALCVIEAVLGLEAETGGAYTEFFRACAGEIAPLGQHARASIKGPAGRVLAALGVEDCVASNRPAAAAPSAPAAPPANLLDFDEPTPVLAAAPSTAAPVAAVSGPMPVGGNALFSGLSTKAALPVVLPPQEPTPPPQQQAGNLLGGAPASNTGSNDLFGNMTLRKAEPANAETMASGATSQPNPAPVASTEPNNLFGNMTLKSAAEPAKVEVVTSSAASEPSASCTASDDTLTATEAGSAFGFMNAASTSSAPPPPEPSTQVSTPVRPSSNTFDPLLSMGMASGSTNNHTNTPVTPNPNTVNQMAQMQQMQMAYQQNIMLMQQQMQQMQMGNFQRQGSNGSRGVLQGVPTLSMPGSVSRQPIMGANYMRQVPGVSGDSTFSFLGASDSKQDNHSFDFVKDAMKNEKK